MRTGGRAPQQGLFGRRADVRPASWPFASSGAGHCRRSPPVGTSVSPMSNFGFGFSPFESNEPGQGPDDLAGKIPLFAELQRLLAGNGGPVNWDLARQLAISASGGQPPGGHAGDARGGHRSGPAGRSVAGRRDRPAVRRHGRSQAWSRVDWVEKTIGTWAALCDPVASRVVSRHVRRVAGRGGRTGRSDGTDDVPARRHDVRRPTRAGTGRAGRRGRLQFGDRPAARPSRHGGAGRRQPRPSSPPSCERPLDEVRLFGRCARQRISGCSHTCRGYASRSSTRSTPMAAASRSTRRPSLR